MKNLNAPAVKREAEEDWGGRILRTLTQISCAHVALKNRRRLTSPMSGRFSWSPINDSAARIDVLRRSGLKCRFCEVRHGRSNRSSDHVRRRRHAAVAGLTREHAQAVRALDRTGMDLPTGPCTHNRAPTVCETHLHH